MDEFYSLYRGGSAEIEEKKSRFIANIEHVTTEEEATAFIAKIKKQYYDARHNCSAFVIGEGGQIMRSNDDGEPSGTAGRPMLEILTTGKITNAVVVVTRYFGGTLLGTGGLIRAYQGAVKEALNNCVVLKKISGIELIVESDYTDFGKIQYLAASNKWDVMSTDYSDNVVVKMVIDLQVLESVMSTITDSTAGKAKITKGNEVTFSYIDGQIMIL